MQKGLERSLMKQYPGHEDNLVALRRIEGQVRGIQKMISERKYCVEILNQIQAIHKALGRVEERILDKHLRGCVVRALKGKSEAEKQEKINEVIKLVSKFRKS